jgi:hypothetical protein
VAVRKRDQRIKVHFGKSGKFGYASWPEVHEYFRKRVATVFRQSPFEIELNDQASHDFLVQWTPISGGYLMMGASMKR